MSGFKVINVLHSRLLLSVVRFPTVKTLLKSPSIFQIILANITNCFEKIRYTEWDLLNYFNTILTSQTLILTQLKCNVNFEWIQNYVKSTIYCRNNLQRYDASENIFGIIEIYIVSFFKNYLVLRLKILKKSVMLR